MEKGDNKYLGQEKIPKLLIKFAIPCIFAMLVSALYNIVDQIFIGNSELGYLGNAATSVVFPITIVAMAVSGALGNGAAAFLSICQGRKDTENTHKAVGNSTLINFLISLVFVLLGFLFMDNLLYLFGASETSIGLARDYFIIILAFIPAYMLGNMLNSIIRADGSPSFAMASTLVGAITNIILDPIFIFGFNWGIKGAAWATIIGQVLSLIVALVYFTRTKTFRLIRASFKFDNKILSNVTKLGASSFITNMAIVVIALASNMMLAKYGAESKYGADIPIATMGICMKVFTIVVSIAIGIIVGAQPILGYNIGAGHNERVRKTFRLCIITTVVVGIISTIIFEVCPGVIIDLFGVESDLYMEFAALTFRIFLMLVTFTCLNRVISIFFQAVGEPLKSAVVSLIRDIICFVPLVIILPQFLGVEGVLWAAPVADTVSVIISISLAVIFFRKLSHKTSPSSEKVTIEESKPGAIIAISREHGSQGKKIGELVASQLNIPYYYKELTALVAKESGLDAKYIDKAKGNDKHYELYLTTSPAKYAIEAQDAVLKEIAQRGSCVIVGRAADYVLRDNPHIIRVFIYAPKDYRIKNIMRMYNDNKKSAKNYLERSDKARAEYYEMISSQKWGDPKNYDLCIDASLGKEVVSNLICELARNKQNNA